MRTIYLLVLLNTLFTLSTCMCKVYTLPSENTLKERLDKNFRFTNKQTGMSSHLAHKKVSAEEALHAIRQCYNKLDKVYQLAVKSRECLLLQELFAQDAFDIVKELAAQQLITCSSANMHIN